MEWKIPYFEYDLFARVAPGALTIAVAQYIGMPVVAYWEPLLPATATKGTGLDTGIVLFGGLTLIGASYIVGLLYEALATRVWRLLSHRALVAAAAERKTWLRPVSDAVEPLGCDERDLFKVLLQWLLGDTRDGVRYAFAHIHRFQAEARLCAYSVAPTAALAVAAWAKGSWAIAAISTVLAMLLPLCAISRERRRWISGVATLDELRPAGDKRLDALQRQLQELAKE